MKAFTFWIAALVCLAFFTDVRPLQAKAENKQPRMENALHYLQDAKKSDHPLPLLESAKGALKKALHNKHGGRLEALKLVDMAIAEAKVGDLEKMRQKIDAAIANIHGGMSKAP